MQIIDARYLVRVLSEHGHAGEAAPKAIVLPEGEYVDLMENSPEHPPQGDDGGIIIDGIPFISLSAVKDKAPYTVVERAMNGLAAMWWK